VSRPTIEEQLGKVRHRIEELHASGDVPRLRRHLALVDDVEHRVALLQARLDVVERSLGADASGDPATYIAAVSAELESWDTFLERCRRPSPRERGRRETRPKRRSATSVAGGSPSTSVDERLARARDAVGNGWQEHRERVDAAREALAQKADDLSATLS